MKIRFFGTGAGLPSKCRNVSSLAIELLNDLKEEWLFDCGEGTQRLMLDSTLRPANIGKIFITHLHGDHIYGLPGLLSTVSNMGRSDELELYAPKGLKNWLLSSLQVTNTRLGFKLKFIDIEAGFLYDFDKYIVEVFKLKHDVVCYGFKVVQKDLEGVLDAEKAQSLGVPFGPLMGKLKKGEDIVLENGFIVKCSEVVGEKRKGKTIVICGDTSYVKDLELIAKDADVLIHEATIYSGMDESRRIYGHSTNVEAARIAKKANVKLLLMNHISSRYLYNELVEMENESKRIFENCKIVKDMDEYEI